LISNQILNRREQSSTHSIRKKKEEMNNFINKHMKKGFSFQGIILMQFFWKTDFGTRSLQDFFLFISASCASLCDMDVLALIGISVLSTLLG
jgi:hypothetical protein